MFDFNCDVAQSYGVYNKDNSEFELAKYCSTINISAGFHAGDPMSISRAFSYAKEHNVALSAHIGYPDIQGFGKRKIDLTSEELTAVVVYQIGAIVAYAKTFDLEVEMVRCHGALKDVLNSDEQSAMVIAQAVKKVSPWLNVVVQNQKTKELLQQQGVKAALEFEFSSDNTIDEIISTQKEAGFKIDTIHFRNVEDAKKAYDTLKPAPVNYNRVAAQV
ncbi:LamB/YcsF family protein [bacterium]|nr:LamB/YcsF family protein [bacterium]